MRIYADSLHCYGVGKKKKTSLIYLQSPRYCAQSHEMPVRGREYLGGPGIRQRMVGKTQHFIFLKGERSRGSRPANSICVSTPQFRALGRHSQQMVLIFPIDAGNDHRDILAIALQEVTAKIIGVDMWGDNSALGTYGHPAPRCCSFLFRFACLIFSCMASNEIRRTLLEGILFRFAAVTSIPARLVIHNTDLFLTYIVCW